METANPISFQPSHPLRAPLHEEERANEALRLAHRLETLLNPTDPSPEIDDRLRLRLRLARAHVLCVVDQLEALGT